MSDTDSDPASAPPPDPPPDAAARPSWVSLSKKGPLAWMAQNHVAANLLMLVLVIGGLVIGSRVKQEVFPEFELDLVLVNVAYPGASPAEVEQGVIFAIEEAIRGIDGVKEIRSTADEGVGVVAVELLLDTDSDRALADIKAAVDRITSFPEDIERPVVSLATNRFQVINLVIHGDRSERELKALAERTREELLVDERITYVELGAVRPYEISIEISQSNLRRYGLTLEQVAARIRQASVELPGGAVKTGQGEVLVRTAERRLTGSEFADIALLSRPDGTRVRVGDIATVDDGFQESDQEAFFDGERASMVRVFRVGEETPIDVSEAVHEYIAKNRDRLPAGVSFATWFDASEMYRQRIDLLMRNALIGLILVLLVLGLFLEMRLAFWVTLGIPISFIGALLFMPSLGVSINMISLFAFIVTLGMVVDDAIVVGEAVHKRRQEGYGVVQSAIGGVREVAQPVVFAILTSCVAFSPLLFVPGSSGKFFRVIPLIVITVLLISLVESLLVLPAHVAHRSRWLDVATKVLLLHRLHRFIYPAQQRFARWVEHHIDRVYAPLVRWAVERRYLTVSLGIAAFIATLGVVGSGRVAFTFLPKIESDLVTAKIEMPFGTSYAETRRAQQKAEQALRSAIDEHGGDAITRGVFSLAGGSNNGGRGNPRGSSAASATHLAEVTAYLVPLDQREVTATTLAETWRSRLGDIPGLESLTFTYTTGPSGGKSIDIELSHPDIRTLEQAGAQLAEALRGYAGAIDINDGFAVGKEQLDFRLKEEAKSLGITELDLARQVRSAFWGTEAVRQQRGRDEVRAYVRRPLAERDSLHALEQFIVRTPEGGEIPLGQAATVVRGRSYTSIRRVNARRVINVTADVEGGANANEIVRDLQASVLPGLLADTPGLRYGLGGEQKRQAETLGSLYNNSLVALVIMAALLAVAFRSYAQWIIVMSAIPFGFIGAVLGHVTMGYDLSLMSMMGIVALAGVVVNDSLILVVAVNEYRRTMELLPAIVAAGVRRFRPILLTSLTTFFGLVPMIVETSVQARFLIPMAISLGFGVLFATFIILLLVPALYMILEDGIRLGRRTRTSLWPDLATEDEAVAGE